jgi:eukaryotic-like serine/threonine-protein kinase
LEGDRRAPEEFLRRRSRDPLPPGAVLAGRFRVVAFRGEGGMGRVYEAEDLALGERVALKLVHPQIAGDESFLKRFKREIHLARQVTHPNVCRVFDLFVHSGSGSAAAGPLAGEIVFFSMELLEGETLSERLAEAGALAPAEALPIAEQLAAGLEAAHQAGVLHRDLKSGNVFLAGGSGGLRAVITDFGVARYSSPEAVGATTLSGEGRLIGSPAYMAPEQVRGERLTPAADLYALGVVLYEMVTGELPFAGETVLQAAVKRLTEPPPSPRRYVPDLDPAWERTILRCLAPDPGDRPQSAREVLAPLTGTAVAAPRRVPRRRRPRRWVWVAATAILAVAGLVVAWRAGLFGGGDDPSRTVERAAALLATDPLAAEAAGRRAADRARALGSRRSLAQARLIEGQALSALGRHEPAEAALREARQLFLVEADRPGAALAGWQLGRARLAAGDLDAARQHLEDARDSFRQLADRGHEAAALTDLASVAGRQGREDDALAEFGAARQGFAEVGDRRGGVQVLLRLGGLHERSGRLDEALRAYEEALTLAGPGDGDALRADALHASARVLGNRDELATARVRDLAALDLYGAAGDRLGAAKAQRALGVTTQRQGDLAAATRFFEESLDSYRVAGNPLGVALVLNDLALIARRQGSLWRAESLFAEAEEAYHALASLDGEAAARANRGSVLWRRGHLADAAQAVEQAVALNRRAGERRGEARTRVLLASLQLDRGDVRAARAGAEEALVELRGLGLEAEAAFAVTALAEVARAEGDLEGARGEFEAALALHRRFGETLEAAANRLGLAAVALDEGRAAEAAALARAAGEEFRVEQARTEEARADLVVAAALREQGRLTEAKQALDEVARRSAASEDLRLRLSLAIEAGRLAAATTPGAGSGRLATAASDAAAAGYLALALEAQLAVGQARRAAGEREAADATLRAVAAEAERRGLGRIARQAAAATAAEPAR